MPNEADQADRGFQELVHILEEAVKAGASCVALDWVGPDLVAFRGSDGIMTGTLHFPPSLESELLEAVVRQAGLHDRLKGKMVLHLVGEEYEVLAEKCGTFDSPAFHLTLKKRGRMKRPMK